MSISIGGQTVNYSQNRERIHLFSTTQSNMLMLYSSPLSNANILFDNNMIFGRNNNTFSFQKDNNTLFTLAPSINTSYNPFFVNNTLEVYNTAIFDSNVFANTFINTPTIFTTNVQINSPSIGNYFETYDQFGNQLFTMNGNGQISIIGDITYVDNITVNNQLIAKSQIKTNSLYAYLSDPTISITDTSRIVLTDTINMYNQSDSLKPISLNANTLINGNAHIAGDLAVDGNFNFTNVTANYIVGRSNIASSTLYLSNLSIPNNDTVVIIHDSTFFNSNIFNIKINSATRKNFSGLIMDSGGLISLGNGGSANGILDIRYDPSYSTCNILNCRGITNTSNIFVINSNINIGIGTTLPNHYLHINQNNKTQNSLIGLYNNTINTAPFINIYSSNTPVLQVSSLGNITVGKISPNSAWNIDVASNIRSPIIQTNKLIGYPGVNCNISLDTTSLCNVGFYYGNSMQITNMTTMKILITDFFQTKSFQINGINIVDDTNTGFVNLTEPSVWCNGTKGICVSPNPNDLISQQGNTTSFGKLAIYAPSPSINGTPSVGISVYGPSYNSIRVTSTISPTIETFRQNTVNNIDYRGFTGIDSDNNFFMAYQDSHLTPITAQNDLTYKPLKISTTGIILGTNNSVVIDQSVGNVAINLGTYYDVNQQKTLQNTANYNLQVSGTTLFQQFGTTITNDRIGSKDGNPILYMDGLTGNVGIGLTNPNYTLDVLGDTNVSGETTINDLFINGNIGIGTDIPQYVGTINPGQSIIHLNSQSLFSQPMFISNTVGINTSYVPPGRVLEINGTVNITKLLVNGAPMATATLTANSLGYLVVSSNMGINTQNPTSWLDINGDLLVEQQAYIYPPVKLLSSTSVVNNVTFNVYGSSMLNILNAFDKNTDFNLASIWVPSNGGYDTTTGNWIGATSNYVPNSAITSGTVFSTITNVDGVSVGGQWIQVQTNVPLYYSSINICADTSVADSSSNPSSLRIVGSYDGVNWTLIRATVGNISWPVYNYDPNNPNKPAPYQSFTLTSRTAFNYVRVIFTNIYANNSSSPVANPNYVAITDINFVVSPVSVYMNNGSIGIGTTQPRQSLDIIGGNILLNGGGSIGVGTLYPKSSLHINSTSYFSSNIGIGTGKISPKFLLDVGGNINFDGLIYQNGNPYISTQWTNVTDTSLNTSNIYINSNVGIGTNFPLAKLHVQGKSIFTSVATFNSNVIVNGTLYTNGPIQSTSDRKIKTDLNKIESPLDKIKQINGYTYTRIDTGLIETGLIAQELSNVMPQLVKNNDDNMLTISYGNMAGLFVEAIKTLNNRIEKLEDIIFSLTGSNCIPI